ncbi:hypothetical protein ACO0LG_22700 [Undibacterium sp. Ji42W]|uniref:hypothetical protein n=1 Tax=Undibacterium sp. Ji42W TaxID=3413039 RepID=UPI003BF36306
MSWYKTGLVALTNGSNIVAGTGTDFISNVRAGSIFAGPDGKFYEVAAVASSVSLALALPYAGVSAVLATYAIVPTQGYIADLAKSATDLLNTFGAFRDAYVSGALNGKGLELKGILAGPGNLPANPASGDAYLVGYSIYVWSGTAWTSSSIRGATGDKGDKGDTGSITPELQALRDSALAASQTAAQTASTLNAALTAFSKVFLGNHPNDPTTDAQGAALLEGAEYYNTTTRKLRLYSNGGWADFDGAVQLATGNAALSATNAAASATNAARSESAAHDSEQIATAKAASISTTLTAVTGQKDIAVAKATEAQGYAGAAAASALLAQQAAQAVVTGNVITSVNGKVGAVVLKTTDLADYVDPVGLAIVFGS